MCNEYDYNKPSFECYGYWRLAYGKLDVKKHFIHGDYHHGRTSTFFMNEKREHNTLQEKRELAAINVVGKG